jgi:hypothetical protein
MVHCHTTRKPSGIINYNTPNIILNFIMQLHGNDIMVQSKDRTNCNLVAQSETFYHPTFICVNPQKAAKILHVQCESWGEEISHLASNMTSYSRHYTNTASIYVMHRHFFSIPCSMLTEHLLSTCIQRVSQMGNVRSVIMKI